MVAINSLHRGTPCYENDVGVNFYSIMADLHVLRIPGRGHANWGWALSLILCQKDWRKRMRWRLYALCVVLCPTRQAVQFARSIAWRFIPVHRAALPNCVLVMQQSFIHSVTIILISLRIQKPLKQAQPHRALPHQSSSHRDLPPSQSTPTGHCAFVCV